MAKKYWIKERINPQLETYYVACGQLSQAEAKKKSDALYGSNVMHAYESEQEYEARLQELRTGGKSVS